VGSATSWPRDPAVLRQVLATGTPAYTGIYQSSSGTWITAFAPVRDASLKPVAVLDVDFERTCTWRSSAQ